MKISLEQMVGRDEMEVHLVNIQGGTIVVVDGFECDKGIGKGVEHHSVFRADNRFVQPCIDVRDVGADASFVSFQHLYVRHAEVVKMFLQEANGLCKTCVAYILRFWQVEVEFQHLNAVTMNVHKDGFVEADT